MIESKWFIEHLKFFFPLPILNHINALDMKELLSDGKPTILIACMPKSGSTFVTRVLEKLTGFTYYDTRYHSSQNEQDLYLPNLIHSYSFPNISHQHVKATSGNKELIKNFNIRPIVMTRNLVDVVLSIRDHFYQESTDFPLAYVTTDFFKLTEERQLDYIIDIMVPWYFNFYVSWYESCFLKKDIDALWIRYEDLIADKPGIISKILSFYHHNKSIEEITSVIHRFESDKVHIRFNVGKSGRGKEALTHEQLQRIYNFASYYPKIDFSMIGIPKTMGSYESNDMVKVAEYRQSGHIPEFVNSKIFYHIYKRKGNIYIFGTGSAGTRTYECIQGFISHTNLPIKVVEFWDNDPTKWGNKLFDLPISKPKDQLFNSSDIILVASQWYSEITEQLINMGHNRDTILPVFYE